ncbi:hypothetical protein SCLCIDRAFT_30997 [Scleroderma citrinum Foug A]|uniref:Uncharacterized protein n=1 Tax=Scleroderma citrinum Foug A TaxID=1036808 RepID=A0A0C3D144_9AGAM|nr:hypothetical protein SCLCIDRAFT_30997 [Scleroderma citrinum Foug A]
MLHPYSPTLRQVSPGILDLKVSRSARSREHIQGCDLIRPHRRLGPTTQQARFEGFPCGWAAQACSRFNLDPTTSTFGHMDSVSTFWWVSEWLGESGMSAVSLFVFSCYFGTDMLDLDVYRSDLHPAALPSTFDVSVRTFRSVCGWLHDSRASQSSTSTVTFNVSVQQCCFHLFQVNAAAARCVAHVTVISVSIAITITSPFALDTRRNRLVSTLESSKDKYSTWGRDWHVQWYIHVFVSNTNPTPLNRTLGWLGFEHICHLPLVSDPVRIRMHTRPVRVVSKSIRLPWSTSCSFHGYYHLCFDAQGVLLPGQRICMAPNAICLVYNIRESRII